MRTFNLKSFGMILFIAIFLVGGFFINTLKSEAAGTVKSLGVTYSISSVVSTTNNDGSVTTKVLIGCAPKSGDLYDVNTGRPCTNNVKTTLTGCALGSGDVYDVNTGIACKSYIKSVLVGCALKSGDVYDINTGNKCTKDKTNIIAKLNKIETLTQKDLTLLTPVNNEEVALNEKTDQGPSGREVLMNSLVASAGKVGSIVKGPMSIWIILLIIVIVLGGGYAVYGLLKKDKKNEIKQPEAKPITPNTATPTQTTYTTTKVTTPQNNPVPTTNPVQSTTPPVQTTLTENIKN